MDNFGAPQYDTCAFCEGFYMPNYGEPVCELCHTFVYNARDAQENECVRRRRRVSQTAAATDDKNPSEDSGNDDEDEPERPPPTNEQPGACDLPDNQRTPEETNASIAHLPEGTKRANVSSEQSLIDARLASLSRVTAESLYFDKRLRAAGAAPQASNGSGSVPEATATTSSAHVSANDSSSGCATREREAERDRESSGIERLPDEVLAHIFSFADDLTLFSVRSVCRRWRDVVDNEVLASDGSWEKFTRRRWPLFEPRYRVQSWRLAYAKLLSSAPCRRCLAQITAAQRCNCTCCISGVCGTAAAESSRQRSESASSDGGKRRRARAAAPEEDGTWPRSRLDWRASRLRTEIAALRNDPPDGIRAQPLTVECTCVCCVARAAAHDACACPECDLDADCAVAGPEACSQLVCAIAGPAGSPYEGGLFYVHMRIAASYPMRPPAVRFLTRIFHPNVSRHGDVGLDIILSNWCAGLTVTKTLLSIQSLLTDAYTHVAMEPSVARLYDGDRREFDRVARLWTWKYAMHDYLPPLPIDIC